MAVAHPKPAPEENLVTDEKLRAMMERGAKKVHEELVQLRAEGKIDEHGNLLVPRPADMAPDSETDL